jgi:hypothetical protein
MFVAFGKGDNRLDGMSKEKGVLADTHIVERVLETGCCDADLTLDEYRRRMILNIEGRQFLMQALVKPIRDASRPIGRLYRPVFTTRIDGHAKIVFL